MMSQTVGRNLTLLHVFGLTECKSLEMQDIWILSIPRVY